MTKSLDEILTQIAEEEELSKEFSRLEEIDEIYEYCREFGLESTEEEFDEELSYFIDSNDFDFELDGKELMNIAGGVDLKKYLSKTAAMALSTLTLAGTGAGLINNSSHAAEYKKDNTSISAKEETVKEGKWAKTKASLKRFWKNHKKAIIATTVVTAGAAILGTVAYKKSQQTARRKAESSKTDQQGTKQLVEEKRVEIEKKLDAAAGELYSYGNANSSTLKSYLKPIQGVDGGTLEIIDIKKVEAKITDIQTELGKLESQEKTPKEQGRLMRIGRALGNGIKYMAGRAPGQKKEQLKRELEILEGYQQRYNKCTELDKQLSKLQEDGGQ